MLSHGELNILTYTSIFHRRYNNLQAGAEKKIGRDRKEGKAQKRKKIH